MRLANLNGRLVVDAGSGFADVAHASDGRFSSSPQAVYDDWDGFAEWSQGAGLEGDTELDPSQLGPPVPQPRQVFAVALNYPEHAAEANFTAPETPLIFTKFQTCLTG